VWRKGKTKMADEDDTRNQGQEEQKEQEDLKPEPSDKKAAGTPFLQWVIMAIVVILCAGAGLVIGRIFAGSGTNETAQSAEGGSNQADDQKAVISDLTAGKPQEIWYYNLAPVVANLDVPGVTRYVRLTLTLEIDSQVDQKKGVAFIEEKNPLLTNWLTIYLAGLSLEDIRGDRSLKRIQSQIVDAFNEKLFPDAKPQVKRVLFKEFAIQ